MADLNKFISEMKAWCEERNLGYDQMQRWDIRPGGECDCSSLVIKALQDSGFSTGSASYTGDLRANLVANGWCVVPVDGNPQPGDICLNDAEHVAVCTAPGQLSYASIDERGMASGGQSGDQTNLETKTSNYYNHPWNCYLRFSGAPTPPPTPGEGGTYVCVVDAVRIRTAPSLSAEVVDQYTRGQTVVLDDNFTEADGCVWGTYIGASSRQRRYVAISQNGNTYFQKC